MINESLIRSKSLFPAVSLKYHKISIYIFLVFEFPVFPASKLRENKVKVFRTGTLKYNTLTYVVYPLLAYLPVVHLAIITLWDRTNGPEAAKPTQSGIFPF